MQELQSVYFSFYSVRIRGSDTVELELRVVQRPHQKHGTQYVF